MMYLKDFHSRLSKGDIPGAYVFAGGGEEDYQDAINRLKAAIVDPAYESFNYSFYSGSENGADDVLASVRTRAMGRGGRLVVLRDPKALSKGDQKAIIAYLDNPEAGNCLVIISEEPDRSLPLVRKADEAKIMVNLRLPPWAKRRTAIEEYLKEHGIRASEDVLSAVESSLPDDRGIMRRELEKIILYLGDKKELLLDDLGDLLVDRSSEGIFEMAEYLRRGDRAGAIRIIDKLLETGEAPGKIIGFLARQYRMMLMARELSSTGGDASRFGELKGLPPKVLKSLVAASLNLDSNEILEALVDLRTADRLLKTTSLTPSFVIEALLAGLLPGS